MNRRLCERYSVSLPVKVEWEEGGQQFVEEGFTENIGLNGTLIHLPRRLPEVGSEVNLTIIENSENCIQVTASVLRVERDVFHLKCALLLSEVTKDWEEKIRQYTARLVFSQENEIEDEDDEKCF